MHNKHESIELFKQVQFQLTPSLVKIFANSCSILNMWVAKSCLGLCHHWVTGGYLSVGCAVVCSLVTSGGPPSSAAGGASNRKGRGKLLHPSGSHIRSKITFICIVVKENYEELIIDKPFIEKNLLVKFFLWVWKYYIQLLFDVQCCIQLLFVVPCSNSSQSFQQNWFPVVKPSFGIISILRREHFLFFTCLWS